jgi:hypothetical protein
MADAFEPSQGPSATAFSSPNAFSSPAEDASPRRWYRSDAWLAVTALVSAALALPLAPGHWHAPELAAMLAVAVTALAAGQRWAIALIVLAELLLVPTVWPRAFLHAGQAGASSRWVALATLAAMVPGVLAIPRAAVALVVVSGWPRSQRAYRRVHLGLVALAVIAAALPVL